MAKVVKLELTERQFEAMIEIVDTLSAMLGGGGEALDDVKKEIDLVDGMLKKNGYKRHHN